MLKKREEILRKIIDVVSKTSSGSEVYLYGSRARGSENISSDWDLLILLNTEIITFDIETEFMDALYEIELQTGEVISPLIYTKGDWVGRHKITPLYENIEKEGVRIK